MDTWRDKSKEKGNVRSPLKEIFIILIVNSLCLQAIKPQGVRSLLRSIGAVPTIAGVGSCSAYNLYAHTISDLDLAQRKEFVTMRNGLIR